MPLVDRKRLLSSFRVLFRNLLVRYTCIALRLYYEIGRASCRERV